MSSFITMRDNIQKPNLAFLTSTNFGLAHYVVSLYEPVKKYFNPYYITYMDGNLDDLVEEKITHIYRLLTPTDYDKSLSDTIHFFNTYEIRVINFHVANTAKKCSRYFSSLLYEAKRLGIKIIGTLHDVLPNEETKIDFEDLKRLYAAMDHYIVGSEQEKEKLKIHFGTSEEKIAITVHPPYLIFNNARYDLMSAREKLEIPLNKKVILFFGNLMTYKGLHYLVDAFKLVIPKNPDAFLYISTSLSYNPQFNSYIDNISSGKLSKYAKVVKSYVKSTEIEAIFKAADVVALPYTKIAQSGILQVAFAFKKPVIVTDVFNDTEIIHNRFGKAVKSSDVESLAFAITELISLETEELEKMGRNGHDYMIKRHSWESAADQINQIYLNSIMSN